MSLLIRTLALAGMATLAGVLLIHPETAATTAGWVWLTSCAIGLVVLAQLIARAPRPVREPDPLKRLACDRRTVFLALPFFVLVAGFLFADVAVGGRTAVSMPFWNVENDPGEQTAGFGYLADPWAGFLIEGPGLSVTRQALMDGELPLWNPMEACGAPWLANGEVGALSLLQLPLNLIATREAWDAFAITRFVLAAWLATLLALGLGVRGSAALIPGLAFGFGGAFILHANLVHLNTALCAPLVLLLVEALRHRLSFARFAGLALVIGLALNGGNPQPALVALLAAAVRIVAPSAETDGDWRDALVVLLVVGGATVVGALLDAAALLPLAELLGQSVNRTALSLDAAAGWRSALSWCVPHSGPGAPAAPLWWYAGSWTAIAGLGGLALGILRPRDGAAPWLWPLLLLLAVLYVEPLGNLVRESIPVLDGINWRKYVSVIHLLLGLLGAFALDRATSGDRRAAGALAGGGFAVWLPLTIVVGDGAIDVLRLTMVSAAAIGLGLFAVLGDRARSELLQIVPFLLLIELGCSMPERPRVEQPPLAARPAILDVIEAEHAADETKYGALYRTTAFGDTFPPLLSSALGWSDIRSVSPMPLRSYHEWLAPYANCGAWPPYLLLGASREILLSPCLDLAGVRWVVIKDHRLLTGQADRALEDRPEIRFGEAQRVIRYETLEAEGLRRLDPWSASIEIAEGARIEFEASLFSKRTRIRLEAHVAEPTPFSVRVRIGDDERHLTPNHDTAEWIVEGFAERTPFRIEAEAGAVELKIADWEVDRYLPKVATDFELDRQRVDFAAGVTLLRNKTALPIARMVRRARRLADEDEFRRLWARFVSTGEGFDWRDEVLLIGDAPPLELPDPTTVPVRPEVQRLDRPSRGRLTVELDAAAPGWLALAVVDDGYWVATRRGQPVPLVRANGPFVAVPITRAGLQTIELVYRPLSFGIGCTLSLATLGGLLLAALLRRRSRRR